MIKVLNSEELLNINGGTKEFRDYSPEQLGYDFGRWVGSLIMAIGAGKALRGK